VLDLFRIGQGVVNLYVYAVVLKLTDYVYDSGVADIGTVFLEGEAKHCDCRTKDVVSGADHLADGALGDEPAHAVVDALTGADTTKI
jgi:hypothetical protein